MADQKTSTGSNATTTAPQPQPQQVVMSPARQRMWSPRRPMYGGSPGPRFYSPPVAPQGGPAFYSPGARNVVYRAPQDSPAKAAPAPVATATTTTTTTTTAAGAAPAAVNTSTEEARPMDNSVNTVLGAAPVGGPSGFASRGPATLRGNAPFGGGPFGSGPFGGPRFFGPGPGPWGPGPRRHPRSSRRHSSRRRHHRHHRSSRNDGDDSDDQQQSYDETAHSVDPSASYAPATSAEY